MKLKLLMVLLMLALPAGLAYGQDETAQEDTTMVDSTTPTVPLPAPVTQLTAKDKPNDHGHALLLEWVPSADDGAGNNSVMGYEVLRWRPYIFDTLAAKRSEVDVAVGTRDVGEDESRDWNEEVKRLRAEYLSIVDRLPDAHAMYPEGGEFVNVGLATPGATSYENSGPKDRYSGDFVPDYCDFYYRVDAITADETVRSSSEIFGPAQSFGQWFNTGRLAVLAFVLVFGALTIFFVSRARGGAELYIRPIGGIEAVDEAIGRATEMGRPILYVLGLGTAADVATIASFTILGRVAKRVAEYQTELIVPTYDPIVMSVAQEVVKSSYLDAGRPDAYNDDIVFFVTQSQFAYVAAVNGIMLRQRPATNVYMGMFHAESLLLAETGVEAGSIQIAGTDQIAQLPFFIVACDYTLIGEELYAASAYLGREPVLLGSLKAQDFAKAAVLILAIAGLVAANLEWSWFTDLFHVTD